MCHVCNAMHTHLCCAMPSIDNAMAVQGAQDTNEFNAGKPEGQSVREVAAGIKTHGGTEVAVDLVPGRLDASTSAPTKKVAVAAATAQSLPCSPALHRTATLTADGPTAQSVAVAGLTAHMLLMTPMHHSIQ